MPGPSFRQICVLFLLLRSCCTAAGQPMLRDTQFYPPSYFKVVHHGVEDGLPSEYLYAVIADSLGRLWLSSNRGIAQFDPRKERFIIYTPWWHTGWAYTLYCIILAGALYGAYRFQKRRWVLAAQLQMREMEAKRLKELDALKSRFYTNISHDFRTLLAAIAGLAGQMLRPGGIPLPEGVQRIQQNSRLLLHLVDQLLDVSKLENGKLSLQTVQTDIVRLLRQWVDEHQVLAADRPVNLSLQAEPNRIIADVDTRLLHHIISNLLSNALKFTPRGGEVTLSAVCSALPVGQPTNNEQPITNNQQLTISIRDTGPGIPIEQAPYLFDRFFGMDKRAGSGLGLSFVKELAGLMGASMSVKSEPGGDTTVHLELPLSRRAPVVENPLPQNSNGYSPATPFPPGAPLSPASPRVLIVEDNPDMIRYLSNLLGNYYHVVVARNGEEALRVAASHAISLVVSAIMMDEMDEGFTLCQKLKNTEATAHLPVILLNAHTDRPSRLKGLGLGADAYLSKPLDEKELLTRISQLIQLRQVLLQKYQKQTLQTLVGQFRLAPTDQELLEQLNTGCLKHLADRSFGLARMASLVGKSTTTFNEWLQARIGFTPAEYLRRIRLGLAHELILGTRETVESIAARTGFTDGAYLAKKYKQEYGNTPREARKNLQ